MNNNTINIKERRFIRFISFAWISFLLLVFCFTSWASGYEDWLFSGVGFLLYILSIYMLGWLSK